MGKNAIISHFHREDWPFEVVKSGDEISLGQRTLSFLETRMLHWPDSMFTYAKEDGILFTSDAFGQHLQAQRVPHRHDRREDRGVEHVDHVVVVEVAGDDVWLAAMRISVAM